MGKQKGSAGGKLAIETTSESAESGTIRTWRVGVDDTWATTCAHGEDMSVHHGSDTVWTGSARNHLEALHMGVSALGDGVPSAVEDVKTAEVEQVERVEDVSPEPEWLSHLDQAENLVQEIREHLEPGKPKRRRKRKAE